MLSYKTFKDLDRENIYDGLDIDSEVNNRFQMMRYVPLTGMQNEKIGYVQLEEIKVLSGKILKAVTSLNKKREVSEFILLEGFSSATIEGARTTVQNVKRCIENPLSRDDKMVANTISALNYAYKNRISKRNIVYFWNKIVDGVCENQSAQGSVYRKDMVYVGSVSRIVHTPEKPENIESRMSELFDYVYKVKSDDILIRSIISHFYLVYIHPMCDGNGRLARAFQLSDLYWNWSTNIRKLPFSTVILKNIEGYYKSIFDSEYVVEKKGVRFLDVTPFVVYMLNVFYESIIQCIDLSDAEKIILAKVRKGKSISVSKAILLVKRSEEETRKLLNELENKGFFKKEKLGNRNIYFRY